MRERLPLAEHKTLGMIKQQGNWLFVSAQFNLKKCGVWGIDVASVPKTQDGQLGFAKDLQK